MQKSKKAFIGFLGLGLSPVEPVVTAADGAAVDDVPCCAAAVKLTATAAWLADAATLGVERSCAVSILLLLQSTSFGLGNKLIKT